MTGQSIGEMVCAVARHFLLRHLVRMSRGHPQKTPHPLLSMSTASIQETMGSLRAVMRNRVHTRRDVLSSTPSFRRAWFGSLARCT